MMDQLLHDELKHMCETRRDIDTTERSKARWNAIIALIDAALAEPKKLSTCPECGGSGVYQEYDEYDRYTVHACAKCGGSGELLAEPDADVAEAIGSLESDCEYGEQQEQNKVAVDVFDLRKAITALRQYQKPTDEAVQRAIEWAAQEEKSAIEDQHFSKAYHLDVIQTALRQMGSTEHSTRVTDKCEWTKDTYSQCEECGQAYLDNRGYDFCPNCGRPLKGGE